MSIPLQPTTTEEFISDIRRRMIWQERRPGGYTQRGPNALHTEGVISTTYTGGYPTVTLDDTTVLTDVPWLPFYSPVRGQRVLLERVNGYWTITGPAKPTVWADLPMNATYFGSYQVLVSVAGYYGKMQVGRTADGVVLFRGLAVAVANSPANALVATLPVGFRPLWKMDFIGIGGGNTVQMLTVDTNGEIRTLAALTAGNYLSLNNIIFPTDPTLVWTALNYGSNWSAYVAAGYPTPGTAIDKNGVVWTRGAIKCAVTPAGTMFTYPAGQRPDQTHVQANIGAANVFTTSGVDATGLRVLRAGNPGIGNRFSLEGMPFVSTTSFMQKILLNVSFYGAPFTQPGYFKTPEGLVICRGLTSSAAVTMFMPPNARPAATRLWAGSGSDLLIRYDLTGFGNSLIIPSVTPSAGTYTYISFDVFNFIAEDAMNPAP